MNPIVDIIIPTYSYEGFLTCLHSILRHQGTPDLFNVIVVNNGPKERVQGLLHPQVTVIQAEKNLGWEGGLKKGLEISKAPFVVFLNDDVFVPQFSSLWMRALLNHFVDPHCAAAGPTSNFVMGSQNMFADAVNTAFRVPFLIGFCLMIRRSDLDAAGGVDDSLPGGDDIDLSIRLRGLGKFLICDKNVFLYHHGCQTGIQVHGGYWNSIEMLERTNTALIKKHGLRVWYETLNGGSSANDFSPTGPDSEGDLVRKYVLGSNVLEIGCGATKTVPSSMGIDLVPNGGIIPGLASTNVSVADLTGDASDTLPVPNESVDTIIARHILEHLPDLIQALDHWGAALRPNGRLIIAVPDQAKRNTIPMNYQHVHAFTQQSLQRLMEKLGWKTELIEDAQNNISFVGVFHKNGLH